MSRLKSIPFTQNLIGKYDADVERIRLVQDNLNTHIPASFYEVLDPEAAFDLSQRFEMHYTPKKDSWLNMAEVEFSALSIQCLDRRIGNVETLSEEVQAWTTRRNLNRTTVNWQFIQTKARFKLERHYQNVKKLSGKTNKCSAAGFEPSYKSEKSDRDLVERLKTTSAGQIHSSRHMGFSPFMKPISRRANPHEETTDWGAECGKIARTVRRAGRGNSFRPLSTPFFERSA